MYNFNMEWVSSIKFHKFASCKGKNSHFLASHAAKGRTHLNYNCYEHTTSTIQSLIASA